MARLPTPGGDSGNWGNILNDYLSQVLKSDGSIKDNIIGAAAIADNSITEAHLDSNVVTKLNATNGLIDGSVTDAKIASNAAIAKTKLATVVQNSLMYADSSVQTVNGKSPTSGAVTLAASDIGALTQSTADSRYFIGTKVASAPSSPATDDLWYDKTNDLWKRWNGSAWVITGTGYFATLSAMSALTARLSALESASSISGMVYRSGTQLMLNGARFRAVGSNIYDLLDDSTSEAQTRLTELAAAGVNTVRCWCFSNDGTAGTAMQARLDSALTVANSLGIKLLLTLSNHFNDWGGPNSFGMTQSAWYTQVNTTWWTQVQTLLNAYKNNTAILGWEIINEPRPGSDSTSMAWLETVAAQIKAIDTHHLISSGSEGFLGGSPYPTSDANSGAPSNITLSALNSGDHIDIASMHFYTKYITSDYRPDTAKTLAAVQAAKSAANALGKPLIIGEAGFDPNDFAGGRPQYFDDLQKAIQAYDVDGGLIWNWGRLPAGSFTLAHGDSASDLIMNTWAYTLATPNGTVRVQNPGSQTGSVGTASTTIQMIYGNGTQGAIAWSAANLPAGVSINSTSGVISGTPTTASTVTTTVTATSSATGSPSGSTSFSWHVTPPITTLSIRVASGSDDSFHSYNPGSSSHTYQTSSNDVPVGLFDSSQTALGAAMRFTSISIPKSATIVSASLTLVSSGSDSASTVNSKIRARAQDNGTMPPDDTTFHAPGYTSAVVNWDAIPAWSNGSTYVSPDISVIVQEIVNRSGWASGNSIVLLWDDLDMRSTQSANVLRRGESFNNVPTSAPLLRVSYY